MVGAVVVYRLQLQFRRNKVHGRHVESHLSRLHVCIYHGFRKHGYHGNHGYHRKHGYRRKHGYHRKLGYHQKNKWQYLVGVMISKHKWAMEAVALRYRSSKLQGCVWKKLDTKAPRGLTMRGARWGWREVAPSW